MGKKSLVTQNLANGYPQWSRVRQDEQSVGQSFLNVIGNNMEPLVTELRRGYDNLFLSTANVGEIDLTYVFNLPSSFEFKVQTPNDSDPAPVAPSVSGLIDSTWYQIQEVESGRLSDFWYNAIATRISIETTISGSASKLVEITGETLVANVLNTMFLDNHLTVEVSEGTTFYTVEGINVRRAKLRISGETWKGTQEDEEIIFLFNQRKKTNKVWKSLKKVELVDFPADATVKIYSHQFNLNNYADVYNDQHQFPDSRDDMSVFWDLTDSTTVSGVKLIQRKKYAVSNAVDLLKNQTAIIPERSWELLDTNGLPIAAKDLALIPYSQRAWITDGSKLYLYDLDWTQPNISRLSERTSGALCRIEVSSDYPTRNEEVAVDLIFIKPIKTLVRHRLKIQYPDGQEFGVLEDGTLVATSTDFWIHKPITDRFLRSTTIFEFADLGEHLLTLECEYLDGTNEVDQRLILVDAKKPLATFDLPFVADGLDIDHLQRLLVLGADGDVRHLNLHYDVMLIDYQNKEIIFREEYDEVKVVP